MKTKISAPAGMTGLACEPWSRGEVYAVAANWAEASCPVRSYGDDGWGYIEGGLQVADFRHNARAALEDVIRRTIEACGEEPNDEEGAGRSDDTVLNRETLPLTWNWQTFLVVRHSVGKICGMTDQLHFVPTNEARAMRPAEPLDPRKEMD
jgi:hypothetical protein